MLSSFYYKKKGIGCLITTVLSITSLLLLLYRQSTCWRMMQKVEFHSCLLNRLFAWPSLLLSVGLHPVMSSPPKGDFIDILSIDCHHVHLIPILLSYSFNSLIHILLKMPVLFHSWNRLWHVEPEPYSLGSIFHWQPVLRT